MAKITVYLVEDKNDPTCPFCYTELDSILDDNDSYPDGTRVMVVKFKPTKKIRRSKSELVSI